MLRGNVPRVPVAISEPETVSIVFTDGHGAIQPGDGESMDGSRAHPAPHLNLAHKSCCEFQEIRSGECKRENESGPVLQIEGSICSGGSYARANGGDGYDKKGEPEKNSDDIIAASLEHRLRGGPWLGEEIEDGTIYDGDDDQNLGHDG